MKNRPGGRTGTGRELHGRFEEGPTLDNVLLTLQNTVPDFNYRIDGNTVRITENRYGRKISK